MFCVCVCVFDVRQVAHLCLTCTYKDIQLRTFMSQGNVEPSQASEAAWSNEAVQAQSEADMRRFILDNPTYKR